MTASVLTKLLASGDWWSETINDEIIKGNEIWRLGLVLLVVLVAMAAGRIVQFAINSYAARRDNKRGVTVMTLFLRCLTRPISVAIFAVGLYLCKLCLVFEDKTAVPVVEGISSTIEKGWTRIAQAVAAIALAYGLYRLVDVIEHYLQRWTGKTKTRLDDMLVPVLRKSLRATIAIIGGRYCNCSRGQGYDSQFFWFDYDFCGQAFPNR
jgi:MscS family membrane protein